jgi:hypothetical protein
METKFIYDLILPYFLGDDDLRPAMQKVHKDENGYLYATDGHILIRVPHYKVCKQYEKIPAYPNAEKIMQDAIKREGNITATIHTNELICMLVNAVWRRIKYGDKCKECDGDGVIECEHCGSEYECKECKGNGKINIHIKEFSLLKSKDNYIIKIGSPTFKADYLQIIAIAAQMLQANEITYSYKDDYAAIFSFAGVDILLMPYLADITNAEIVFKIK